MQRGALKRVDRLLDRALLDGNLDSRANVELQKYFHDVANRSVIYLKLIQKAQADRSRRLTVLNFALEILKSMIPQNPPDAKTLQKLDQFTRSVATKYPRVKKAATLVRTMIAKAQRPKRKQESRTAQPRRGRLFKTLNPPESTHPDLLETRQSQEAFRTIANTNISLLNSSKFGGQFKPVISQVQIEGQRKTRKVKLTTDLDTNHVFSSPSPSEVEPLIEVIGRILSRDAEETMRESGELTIRRKGLSLFSFKHYIDQVRVELSLEEYEALIDSLVSIKSKQKMRMATKLFIKIVLDMYADEDNDSKSMIKLVFLEMIASTSYHIRANAFNIFYNLFIHSNLFCKALHVPSSSSTNKSNEENLLKIQEIQLDLFEKLCDILLVLVLSDENSQKVWKSAVNVFMFVANGEDGVPLPLAKIVDIRIISTFLKEVIIGDATEERLIQLLVNKLYNSEGLVKTSLRKIGGINFIIDLLLKTSSNLARNNLFTVLYDSVVPIVNGYSKERAEQLLAVLNKAKFPLIIPGLIMFWAEDIIESVIKFLLDEHLRRTKGLAAVKRKISNEFATAVLVEIKKVCENRWSLNEYIEKIENIKRSKTVTKEDLSLIKQLLEAGGPCRRTGAAFLYELIDFNTRSGKKRRSRKNILKNGDLMIQMFESLLKSNDPELRLVYLHITHRQIQSLKARKIREPGNMKQIKPIFKFMTERLENFIKLEIINITQAARLLFEFIGINQGDKIEVFEGFIKQKVLIPLNLLEELNPSLIKLLSERSQVDKIKISFFILLKELCKSEDNLKIIGGPKYFKDILLGDNPTLAFYSAVFLKEYIQNKFRKQYKNRIAEITKTARQENDTSLIENPYFMVKELIKSIKI